LAVRTPLPRRPRLLIPLFALVALVIVVLIATRLWTDLLFYRSVNASRVFSTVLGTRTFLFVVFGLIMALAVGANIVVAFRLRPPFRPMSLEQQNLERYRVSVEPYLALLLVAVSAACGVLAGLSAAGRWQTWLSWRHGQQFGQRDAQFHRDISYFTFTYPFQRFLLGFAFTVLVLSLLAAAATHYLFGGIRLQTQGEKVVAAAKAHLSVLLALFMLLKAIAYYLDRFGLAFSPRGIVTGASYTDIHAVLPAKTILLFISLLCAVLFVYNIFQRGWILPALSMGILVISAIVIGGLYPLIIQQLQVSPNAAAKERPYISRNITATRLAYGLDAVKYTTNQGGTVTASDVRNDKGTIPYARLLDPVKLAKTYEQLQQIRSYYGFPDTLDVDRYTVNGKRQDYVVSVRELNQAGLNASQRNWVNLHLNYTHGKGFVAAPANAVDKTGKPAFSVLDLPVSGPIVSGKPTDSPIVISQDRIYFGEQAPDYSVVDTKQAEIDGPSQTNSTAEQTNRYDGSGGVPMGSTFRKLLFALRFQDKNLLISGALSKDSRIIYERNPRDRVQKVAPWLTLDGDPYPAVVNGRILWIIDGYTTSDGYPYSERRQLGDVTVDATTGLNNRPGQQQNQVNYIRNSVKATVDAYDGTVKLYQFGARDPVLETWKSAFPGIVQPPSAMPPGLSDHLRYPEDLFKVQRDLLGMYHVTDPTSFFTSEDFWAVPPEPAGTQLQPPFYLFNQSPGQSGPNFNLTSALIAKGSSKLASFVSVSSDPGDYGAIRVLTLPQGTTINGPVQARNTITANGKISQQLSLLSGKGSAVVAGNLLTLPVAGGLIYIEPYYVQSTDDQGYPTLQDVAVVFGDRAGFAPTLAEALNQVFGQGAGSGVATASPTPSGSAPPSGSAGNNSPVSTEIQGLIAQAQRDYAAGQQALRKGDFAAYGAAQAQLQQALTDLSGRAKATPSASASPSARPSAKPTARPTPTSSP